MDADVVAQFQFTGQDIPWLLGMWAEAQPDTDLLVWVPREGGVARWTYAEFLCATRRLAAGLAARGIAEGDKVVIHCDNSPEMVLAWYACATVGAVGVTTNTRSVAAEMTYFVDQTDAVAAITQPQYAALVAAAGPGLKWIVVTDDNSGTPATAEEAAHGLDSFDSLYGSEADCPSRPADPMAPAGIMFTSGTTSRPKAVVHTHANALWAARVGPTNISMHPGGVYLIFLPFFHVNAQSWSMWTTVLGAGGTIVLQPKFSASRFWSVIAEHDVTHISLLPIVYTTTAGQEIPPNKLEVGVFGAIAPPIEQMLGGVEVVPAFGMTETVIHASTAAPYQHIPPGSLGKPTPGYEFLVVDPDTDEVLDDGRVGELLIRGTRGIQLFLEYYGNPEADERSFTADGFFRTGDRVRIGDGGAFFYSERDKDMLKVGGENVSGKEVEDLCRQVPGVRDVAVVGRSHPTLDVVPVAFVVKGPDAPDDADLEQQVIALATENLSNFKVPRAVYFVDDFPRATLDKIAKNKLREQADALPEPF
jgi:crotonobetaine/carnitine-CoA ligase